MTLYIEIVGMRLRLPDGTEIDDCCASRTDGVLSKAASLALMPYMNEDVRQDAEYERVLATFAEGDLTAPDAPPSLYAYVIDGQPGFFGKVVERDKYSPFFLFGANTPTGQVGAQSLSELKRILGIAE